MRVNEEGLDTVKVFFYNILRFFGPPSVVYLLSVLCYSFVTWQPLIWDLSNWSGMGRGVLGVISLIGIAMAFLLLQVEDDET